jgi:hypothetical protein
MTQTCLKTCKGYQEIARWRMHVVPWSLIHNAMFLVIVKSEDGRQAAMSDQKSQCVQKKLNGETRQEKIERKRHVPSGDAASHST